MRRSCTSIANSLKALHYGKLPLLPCACIDIGSNTTRLLVADREPDGSLREIAARREFTLIGRSLGLDRAIPDDKLAETAAVVAAQVAEARDLGADRIEVVATAAVRDAANRVELVNAILDSSGLELRILTGADEARLCFAGATRELEGTEPVAVVDVGGGSTEIAVGVPGVVMIWFATLPTGSAVLSDHLVADPPHREEVEWLRALLRRDLQGLEPPGCSRAVAVGGSATSLRRLVGPELSAEALAGAVELLLTAPCAELAERTGLAPERIRLLPAGLLVLEAVAQRLGMPLDVVNGGLREGVLLELLDE